MPLIFPGIGTETNQSGFASTYTPCGFNVPYYVGLVPEFGCVYNTEFKVESVENQSPQRSSIPIFRIDEATAPTFNPTGGVNGYPCLEFNGWQCLDLVGTALDMAKDAGGLTFAIIHEPAGSTGYPQRLFDLSTDSALDGLRMVISIADTPYPYGQRYIELTPSITYDGLSTYFTPRDQPCCEFFSVNFSTGEFRYYYNFALCAEGTFTDIGNAANVSALGCRIGAAMDISGGVVYGYNGKITRFDIWAGTEALDPLYLSDIAQSYRAKYFPPLTVPSVMEMIYCAGDSNMHGYGTLTYDQYIPYLISQGLSSPTINTRVLNYAAPGLPTSGTLSYLECGKYTLARMTPVGTKNKILCFMGNTNDITYGDTNETIIDNLTELCQFYKQNGFLIVGSNTLPRSDYSGFNDQTIALNALISANYATIGYDVFVDVYNAVDIDYNFQVDGVHLNPSGTAIVSQLFINAIESLPTFSNPVFEDDFAGSVLSDSKWITTLAWGARSQPESGEQQWYADSAVTVGSDKLTITATNVETETGYPYTSGMICSYGKHSQTYGYFEMKAKLPAGKGYWPAFWMLPDDQTWPPEIDIMENGGKDTTKIICTAHYPDPITGESAFTAYPITTPDVSSDYHVYGCDWRSDRISWFFDGANVANFTIPSEISNKSMYLIANLAIGSNWEDIGFPDGTTTWPGLFEIDYIRAWS